MQAGIQSSTYSRLCSSAPMRQKALNLLLRHCGRTSKGIYRSEPGELPTSLFLPLLPISYRNCSGRRRILLSLECKCMIRHTRHDQVYHSLYHLNTHRQWSLHSVWATDLLKRPLSNHKISCSTHKEHKPKDLPLNPLKDQASYLVSSVAM